MTKYRHIPTQEVFEKNIITCAYQNERGWNFPSWMVEHSDSKDWEEIEEKVKDYEILHSTFEGEHAAPGSFWATQKIHSVRRLSDGKEFTVGDHVCYNAFSTEYKIETFIPNLHGLAVGLGDGGPWPLEDIFHAPKKREPLFTSEDGKEIFAGDKIFCVYIYENEYRILPTDPISDIYIRDLTRWKHLSTREAAEDYVINHKPVFTLKDIITALWQNPSEKKQDYIDEARERCGFTKASPCTAHNRETEKEL